MFVIFFYSFRFSSHLLFVDDVADIILFIVIKFIFVAHKNNYFAIKIVEKTKMNAAIKLICLFE